MTIDWDEGIGGFDYVTNPPKSQRTITNYERTNFTIENSLRYFPNDFPDPEDSILKRHLENQYKNNKARIMHIRQSDIISFVKGYYKKVNKSIRAIYKPDSSMENAKIFFWHRKDPSRKLCINIGGYKSEYFNMEPPDVLEKVMNFLRGCCESA
jgi:hypothetical protein